jgi:hypothetical protein
VKFLGHVASAKGIGMQLNNVEAVSTWPEPTSKVELQSFLGLANYYRRFINTFSSVVAPLTDATKSDKKAYRWREEQGAAFRAVKRACTTAPVLRLPDTSEPFVVTLWQQLRHRRRPGAGM